MTARIPKPAPWSPWVPPKYEIHDVVAIQAVAGGTATPEQQQAAMRYIVDNLAGTYGMSYCPGDGDGRRDSDFAEGRRFVGLQLVKLIKLNVSLLRRKQNG
ncbi:MAG: hypothetical protein FJ189_00500 [Gammaproteobacteria bacterium]|nr:hypothetical protein [Gammaproteobacteria bacterium]